jgi:hypothetical protein
MRPIILLWYTSVVLHDRVLLSGHGLTLLVVLSLGHLVVQSGLATGAVLTRMSFGGQSVEYQLLGGSALGYVCTNTETYLGMTMYWDLAVKRRVGCNLAKGTAGDMTADCSPL